MDDDEVEEVDEDEAVQVVHQQVLVLQMILQINQHEVEQIIQQELRMTKQRHEQM